MSLSLPAFPQTTGLLFIAVKALHVSYYSGAGHQCLPFIAGKIVAPCHSPVSAPSAHTHSAATHSNFWRGGEEGVIL